MIRTVVHYCDGASFGGTEQEALYLLQELDPARWRAVLFHRPLPALAPLAEPAERLGVTLREVPSVGMAGVPTLARAIRREGASVFHAHQNWPLGCAPGLAAAAAARVPARVATTQLFGELPQSVLLRAGHRALTSTVDRYIAVSHDVAHRLRDCFGVPKHKLRVIRNGIDPAAFDRPPDPQLRRAWDATGTRRIVLTVARLVEQKGLEFLVDAAAHVPGAIFVIAGDGPDRGRLAARATAAGVGDRILLVGHRTDVPDLLASCDLFVLPSLWEGFPLSVLEAMAAGKPVVASAVGGTNEAITDRETGLLVPSRDAAALARAIGELLSDDALASRLSVAARKRAATDFSAAATARRVVALYDELLDRGENGTA